MKKIILNVIVFVLLILQTPTFAQISYQIYVHDIKIEKPAYQVGEMVKGEFSISNLADLAQSDIMYEISSGAYDKKTLSLKLEQSFSQKFGPVYLKAKSKDTLSFEYKLPESLTGESAVQITATLKDGTFVARGLTQISVSGQPVKEYVSILNEELKIEGTSIIALPDTGPTVYKEEKLAYVLNLSSSTKKYTFTPTLRLYNRSDNENALIKTITLPSFTTDIKKNTEVKIDLPVDLDPLVYYGVISFYTFDKAELADTYVRYIIAGPIATVRNITTEVLETKKGTEIPFIVMYGRQPIDQFRPEKQIKLEGATISITVKNEKGENVGSVDSLLDLSKSNTLFYVKSNVKAKSLSFSAIIKDSTGKILSEYQTNLPTKDSVENQISYIPKISNKYISLITLISFIILLLIVIIVVYRKRKNKIIHTPFTIIALGFLLATCILVVRDVRAYVEEAGHTFSQHGITFGVTSVPSPLPPEIKIYQPGEVFNLEVSAKFGDCNNADQYFWMYMYANSNDSPNLDYTDGVYSPKNRNWWELTPDVKTTSGWTDDLNYNNNYWKYNGVLQYNYFRDSGGNSYNAKYRTEIKTFNAPTIPGYHKMYFAIFQIGDENSGNGIDDSHLNLTYSQEICVIGAGVCPNENQKPIVAINDVVPYLYGRYEISWIYNDAEGDKQVNYEIQVSPTINDFSTESTKSFTTSYTNDPGMNDQRSYIMSGSDFYPSTKYYVRMRAQSAVNDTTKTPSQWSDWTDGNYSFTTPIGEQSQPTCSCNKTRTLTCKQENGTITYKTENDSRCNFDSYCSVATTTATTTFTVRPLTNRIGDIITYKHDGITAIRNGPSDYTYNYEKPIQFGRQSLDVTLTDSYDSSTTTPANCSIFNSRTCNGDHKEDDTTCPVGTKVKWNCDTNTGNWISTNTTDVCPPDPKITKITIKKTPAITLNKGGTCKLEWAITDKPTGMTCTLTGTDNSTNITIPDTLTSWTSGPLQQNTKYTISCIGGTQTVVPKSVICRINPTIGEI